MPEIIANTTDGYQSSNLTSGWDNTHDKTTSLGTLNTSDSNNSFFGGFRIRAL